MRCMEQCCRVSPRAPGTEPYASYNTKYSTVQYVRALRLHVTPGAVREKAERFSKLHADLVGVLQQADPTGLLALLNEEAGLAIVPAPAGLQRITLHPAAPLPSYSTVPGNQPCSPRCPSNARCPCGLFLSVEVLLDLVRSLLELRLEFANALRLQEACNTRRQPWRLLLRFCTQRVVRLALAVLHRRGLAGPTQRNLGRL